MRTRPTDSQGRRKAILCVVLRHRRETPTFFAIVSQCGWVLSGAWAVGVLNKGGLGEKSSGEAAFHRLARRKSLPWASRAAGPTHPREHPADAREDRAGMT